MVRQLADIGTPAFLASRTGRRCPPAEVLAMTRVPVSSASRMVARNKSFPRPPTASRAAQHGGSSNLRASRRRSRTNNPGNDPSPAGQTFFAYFPARGASVRCSHAMAVVVMAKTPARLSERWTRVPRPPMFFVMAPVTKTFTTPFGPARSWMSATVPALSIAGDVWHADDRGETARAAAAVRWQYFPCPSGRVARWTCKSSSRDKQ